MVPRADGLLVVNSAGIWASRIHHIRYSALPQMTGPHGAASGVKQPPGRGARPGSNPKASGSGALDTGPFIAIGVPSAGAPGAAGSNGVGGGRTCFSAVLGAGPIGIGGRSAACPRGARGARGRGGPAGGAGAAGGGA